MYFKGTKVVCCTKLFSACKSCENQMACFKIPDFLSFSRNKSISGLPHVSEVFLTVLLGIFPEVRLKVRALSFLIS